MMIVRKIPTILVSALLVLAAAAQFTGCEKYILPDLSVAPDTLRFSAKADSTDIFLTTNVISKTEAAEGSEWITSWPEWFDEDSDVMIYVRENTGTSERTGILYFKSEVLQRKLTVIQAAPDSGSSPESHLISITSP